jgi:hypothetical protein
LGSELSGAAFTDTAAGTGDEYEGVFHGRGC